MAASTWSTTDKSANLTLTGSNLIATAAGVTVSARGKDPKRTGKYYLEYTSTTTQASTSGLGFATARTPLGTATAVASSFYVSAGSGTNTAYDNFGVQIGGTGSQSGGFTTGTLVCAAIDLDSGLIWFRMAAAGNWNNNAANNPATGTGGISLSGTGLGQGIDCYPFVYLSATANSITANFGGSAFTGAVPAGFTSGWDDSVSIVTNTVATQLAVEQWGSGTPAVWLTQIALEEWASVAATPGTAFWTDDFESYTAGTQISAPWISGGNTPVVTAQAHGGTRSLAAGTNGGNSNCHRVIGANVSQWYLDFWMWTGAVGGANFQQYVSVSSAASAGGTAPSVGVDQTGLGRIGLSAGGAGWGSTFTVTTGAWHHYIFEVTSSATGTAKLTVDDVVRVTYSGDTRDGSNSTTVAEVWVVGVVIGPSPPAAFYVDDMGIYQGPLPVIAGTTQARAMVMA